MGDSMDRVRDVSNVADTAMAVLALHRAGSTPSKGPHAQAVARGVAFVCESVEAADDDSLWVTDVRGTRLQGKIGQYVDTFVAALMLAEVTQQMPDDAGNARVAKALDKVVLKFRREGTEVEVVGLNQASSTLVDRLGVHDKPDAERLMGGH